jgi:hypothetical protein
MRNALKIFAKKPEGSTPVGRIGIQTGLYQNGS